MTTEDGRDADGASATTDGGPELRARAERVLTWVLGLALVLALVGVVYVAMNPPETTDPYTEFYLLGLDGNASGYPTQLSPGESGSVVVGISNHEHRAVDYRIVITWNGTETRERDVHVADNMAEELRVNLTAPSEPGRYKVLFLLYNESGDEPYLNNRLWIEVRDPNGTVDGATGRGTTPGS